MVVGEGAAVAVGKLFKAGDGGTTIESIWQIQYIVQAS